MRIGLKKTGMVCLLTLLALSLSTMHVYGDGNEVLGPPSIGIAQGTAVVTAGVGLHAGQPANLDITIPAAVSIEQVLLYWYGRGSTVGGDDTITIAGNSVQGTLIGSTLGLPYPPSQVYRADITGLNLLVNGANSLAVGDLSFNFNNDGAGLVVIVDDGGPLTDIQLLDGHDFTAFNQGFTDPLDRTVAQTYTFAAAAGDRTAKLDLFIGDAEEERADAVEITIGAAVSRFDNVAVGNDGPEWDTLGFDLDIPAGETQVTVEVLSVDEPNNPLLPDSICWVASVLSIAPEQDDECSLKIEADSCIITMKEPKKKCKCIGKFFGKFKGKSKCNGKGKGRARGSGMHDGGPSICMSNDWNWFYNHYYNHKPNCDRPEPEIICAERLPADGADVEFTYVVTNIGDTDVTNVMVIDNYGEVDGSPIALLTPGESVELVRVIHLNEAVTNTVEGSGYSGNAECVDETSVIIDEEEDPDCGCDGKVTTLTLKNNGDGADIKVIQKQDHAKVFEGYVESGETFSFDGTWKKGTLGPEIIILVDRCKYVKIHTSCSQPIGPGLVAGDFEVVYGESRNAGPLCPLQPGTVQDGFKSGDICDDGRGCKKRGRKGCCKKGGDDDGDDDGDDKDCGDDD